MLQCALRVRRDLPPRCGACDAWNKHGTPAGGGQHGKQRAPGLVHHLFLHWISCLAVATIVRAKIIGSAGRLVKPRSPRLRPSLPETARDEIGTATVRRQKCRGDKTASIRPGSRRPDSGVHKRVNRAIRYRPRPYMMMQINDPVIRVAGNWPSERSGCRPSGQG